MAYCSIEEAWGLKTNSASTAITSNNISSNVYNGNGIENDELDDGVRFDNKYQMKNTNARNVSNRLSTNLRISPQTASSNGITVSSQQKMTQPNAITKPQMDLIPPVNTNLPMYNLPQTHKASLKHIKDNDRNDRSCNSNYQTFEPMGDVSGFLTMDKLQPMSLETNVNNPPFLNDYYDYSSYAPSVSSYGLNSTNPNPNKNEWTVQKESNPLNLLGYDTHQDNNPRFNLVGIPNQLPTSHSYSDNSAMLLNNTPIENYKEDMEKFNNSKNTNDDKQNLKIITEMLDRIRELETEVNYLKLKQNENKTSGSNMHDIILFILVGIFVLFVLDGIFRIGRATI